MPTIHQAVWPFHQATADLALTLLEVGHFLYSVFNPIKCVQIGYDPDCPRLKEYFISQISLILMLITSNLAF